MHIVLLIASGMALAYFSRAKDKESYRIAILAIIGFAYFCIWRFTDFYTDIFFTDSNIKNISFFNIDVVCGDNWVTSLGESNFLKPCHSSSRDFYNKCCTDFYL